VSPLPATSSAAAVEAPPLDATGLLHRYQAEGPPVVEIDALAVGPGEAAALTGASGSGKTTLLYLLTGIEPVRQGSVRWGEVELARLSEGARDRWRRERVGFVFQDFHLVPGLSIERNVLLGCYFDRLRPSPEQSTRARALLDGFEVPTKGGRRVTDLSRGEQQRVAIARALLRGPSVLVADEPTASLDAKAGARVIELLLGAARETGATFLAVTHDPALLAAVDTVHGLERGRLVRTR
jgi:putative ABC transport system ATP-binding protein